LRERHTTGSVPHIVSGGHQEDEHARPHDSADQVVQFFFGFACHGLVLDEKNV